MEGGLRIRTNTGKHETDLNYLYKPDQAYAGNLNRFGSPVPTTGEYNRIWDVVGASHASKFAIKYVDDMVKRDNSFPSEQGPMTFSQLALAAQCDKVPNYGIVDTGMVLNKAIDSVNNWIETGTPAAPTLTMEVDSDGKIVRDENGRAKGGVQLPGFAAPTQVFSMNGPSSSLACRLSAHHDDLSDGQLKARYGSHEHYVELVEQTMSKLDKAGYILDFDKEAMVSSAKASNIAR